MSLSPRAGNGNNGRPPLALHASRPALRLPAVCCTPGIVSQQLPPLVSPFAGYRHLSNRVGRFRLLFPDSTRLVLSLPPPSRMRSQRSQETFFIPESRSEDRPRIRGCWKVPQRERAEFHSPPEGGVNLLSRLSITCTESRKQACSTTLSKGVEGARQAEMGRLFSAPRASAPNPHPGQASQVKRD